MVWIFLLVVLIMCIIAAIIYDRHLMKQKWDTSSAVDIVITRESADDSLHASYLECEMLALEEAVRAHRTIEVIIQRYGGSVSEASKQTGVDVGTLLDTYRRQRDKIRQHIADKYPEIIPKGPLAEFLGYIRDREGEEEIAG